MTLNKTQQKILDKANGVRGRVYVSWTDYRMAKSRSAEIVKVEGLRKKNAVMFLIEKGLVKVQEEGTHHHHVEPNAKYATTGRYVVVEGQEGR